VVWRGGNIGLRTLRGFLPSKTGVQGPTLEKKTSLFHVFRVYVFFRDFFTFAIDLFKKMEYFNISL